MSSTLRNRNRRRQSALERTKARVAELQAQLRFTKDDAEKHELIGQKILINRTVAANTERNLKGRSFEG